MMEKPIFKFLEPYTQKDKDRFFGREADEDNLHELSFNTNLMLIYGASGTGKTSLVQCGLARKFSPTRWKELYVRRGQNIMHSLREKLQEEITTYAYPGLVPEEEPAKAVIQLQNLIFTPVYLIFDQFEELFILKQQGANDTEKKEFFSFVKEITRPGGSGSCHVILVMREEFIAYLWEFEKEVPGLFDYRYRVERMREAGVKEVIRKMLEVEKVTVADTVLEEIVTELKIDQAGIELTHLQVYLDRLYRKAAENTRDQEIVLSKEHIGNMGRIKDVIGDFLDNGLDELKETFKEKKRKDLPLLLLGKMVSDEKTKRVMSEEELEKERKYLGLTPDEFKRCMKKFREMRIIRDYL